MRAELASESPPVLPLDLRTFGVPINFENPTHELWDKTQ